MGRILSDDKEMNYDFRHTKNRIRGEWVWCIRLLLYAEAGYTTPTHPVSGFLYV